MIWINHRSAAPAAAIRAKIDGVSAAAALLLVFAVLIGGIIFVTARIARAESAKVASRIRAVLERVRLPRMLKKRGIDVERYVQATEPAELRTQVTRCEACPSVEKCEEVLAQPLAPPPQDFAFCPNDDAIAKSRDEAEAEVSRQAR